MNRLTFNVFIEGIKELKEFRELRYSIEKGLNPSAIHGLVDAQLPHIVSALSLMENRQCLIITYHELQAKKIFEDLKCFMDESIYLYPAKEIILYPIDAYSHQSIEERIRIRIEMGQKKSSVVVASVESLLNRLIPKNLLFMYCLKIQYGDRIQLDDAIRRFLTLGYERTDTVEAKGQFSIRGGIIDFFPITSDMPYRIELFDDEVDSIRSFDLETQLSIEKVREVFVAPAREMILDREAREKAMKGLQEDIKHLPKKVKGDARKKMEETAAQWMEEIETGYGGKDWENYITYFYEETVSFLDDFEENALIFIDEPSRVREKADHVYREFVEAFREKLERGEILPEQANLLFSYEDILNRLSKKQVFVMTSLPKNNPDFPPKNIINFSSRMAPSFHGKMDIFIEEAKRWKYKGYKTILLCSSVERGKSLQGVLLNHQVDTVYLEERNREILSGQTFILQGILTKGFEYHGNKFLVITDQEIFGISKKKKATAKKKDARPIKSFIDLNIGDYVVHENHGIGKYAGIEQLKVQGVKKDYLHVKYSDGGSLYIPIEQMDLVQKYIGADGVQPKLNKLGGSEWKKAKAKVKGAIEDMAKDLLALYAARQMMKGHAFSPDTPWQRQFEDAFPYEETQDQLKCIEEIKKDMEKPVPMDRLLCGDVGYGKTEVAIRAAFKCVMDGKQVAFLVPTTILAQQHYNTLIQRFNQFPVTIEMLSRFRTESQQDEIIEKLRIGSIDIIVGTHRLLSKDVQLKDLGLLIIDEEQRFGVKHKEALKQLKKHVDVLTLTATPIPRTLHMSLIGLRDMSIIEDPPEERYPIQTYVLEYNDEVVREAILREIHRGGQVYFVFNRVKGIQQMAAKMRRLVPEARIAVGHGQMSERELENVMIDFMNGEFDVLVCTTIIETGLDISNVNTIIVYDADKMGLSQLYQLRGRVGRTNRLAYAYLTYQKDKVLTEVAEKRLKAIKEFTEFGSGFKIAMRDLEIRGAGNLIGAEQHGHMAAIGYDLYCKLLEDTIREMKGEQVAKTVETTIEINVNAFVPEDYIANENHKLEVYKKIASLRGKQDVYDIEEELEDRFGTIPQPVMNLISISYIKAMAQNLGISHISEGESYIKFQFDDSSRINPEIIAYMMDCYGNRIQIHGGVGPYIRLKHGGEESKLDESRNFLEKISGFHRN
ncbi:Transcription-repair-coupling factor [Thermotalea metallivorans]|uniref:Transcription-repair-coupling factor n=1 Tax=Thermotalea metallivorans TaxID=520762 RepID=A0A140L7P3_9FIRM|nr:Transcription-repair-coupling factor [Thermotalea metallivorans]